MCPVALCPFSLSATCKVHLCCRMWLQITHSHHLMGAHCMTRHSPVDLGVGSYFGYCEECCCEHSCSSLSGRVPASLVWRC